jgi:hypothetical protein
MTQLAQSNGQMDFSEFETEKINEATNKKINWFGDKNLSYRKRFFQFLGALISTLIVNFTTKVSWQKGLVLYLLVVVPVGTYVSIKFIINLFF